MVRVRGKGTCVIHLGVFMTMIANYLNRGRYYLHRQTPIIILLTFALNKLLAWS